MLRGSEKHLLFAVLEAILVILVTKANASTRSAFCEQQKKSKRLGPAQDEEREREREDPQRVNELEM